MKSKSKTAREISRLEAQHRELRTDYERVKGAASLTPDARSLIIKLDPNVPMKIRGKVLADMMKMQAGVTGALTSKGEFRRGQFAAMLIGQNEGIGAMSFTSELYPLEMEMVKTRARIIALKNGVGIESMEPFDPPVQIPHAGPQLMPIGVEENWEGVGEKAVILYRRKCIQAFTAATEEELAEGGYFVTQLDEEALRTLPETESVKYPNPAYIQTGIAEMPVFEGDIADYDPSKVSDPNNPVVRQFIAMPVNNLKP